MDFIFEIFCYTAATVTVLAIAGSRNTRKPQQPKQREIAKTLEALSKIGEALPDTEECFEVEKVAAPAVPSKRFGSVATTDEERDLVEESMGAIARYWENTPTPVVIEFPSRKTAAKAIAPEAVAVVEVVPMLEYRTRDDLRALCNANGVQPFDRVGGKRKHWNAQRMVQELSARGYDVVKV